MKNILMLCHRIPYPPNKGDKIRSFNILKYLSQKANVYLVAFVDEKNDWQYVDKVKQYCKECLLLQRPNLFQSGPRLLNASVTGKPLSNQLYYHSKVNKWLKLTLKNTNFDSILVFSSVMGQYIQDLNRQLINKPKLVIDFVDVDSKKWEAYANKRRWPLNLVYKLESTNLSSFEQQLAQLSSANLFVSESEANIFKSQLKQKTSPITWVENGVDSNFFDPGIYLSNPYAKEFNLVFTGRMDYWPNIEAVVWFVKNVVPLLNNHLGKYKFYIVGANPSAEVQSLAKVANVVVTGRVEDIRAYIKHADCAVVPLQVARGIQNKILEALAMNCPVIATAAAMQGLEKVNSNVVSLASTATQWCNLIEELEAKKQSGNLDIKANSREQVLKQYDWNNTLAKLDSFLCL